MSLRRITSGGPWEDVVGYCRAVVAGPWVLVSGSTATVDGQVVGVGDMYAQTVAAFGVALDGLRRAGLDASDVVRTRIYLTDMSRQPEAGRAHHELFADHPPANTTVEVSALAHPDHLVEVEIDAYREPA
ncbi:MAG: RidA family protein [Geodermatophilaceae bacterium]|jgi:enamine deaminase RidA (YjgF/YER057c/UK114 family)